PPARPGHRRAAAHRDRQHQRGVRVRVRQCPVAHGRHEGLRARPAARLRGHSQVHGVPDRRSPAAAADGALARHGRRAVRGVHEPEPAPDEGVPFPLSPYPHHFRRRAHAPAGFRRGEHVSQDNSAPEPADTAPDAPAPDAPVTDEPAQDAPAPDAPAAADGATADGDSETADETVTADDTETAGETVTAGDVAAAEDTATDDAAYDYDVVVVGSGFGGSVSALRLTEKGYRVGVLEAGRRFTRETLPKNSWDLKNYLWAPRL